MCSFRLIFEIEPPRVADFSKIHRQLDIFGPVADAILVPDNHLARPALSSVAIAREIKERGFQAIVGINARDRNYLRLESDLLTLTAYEINEVLFLYGDSSAEGRSTLTVKRMLDDNFGGHIRKGALATIGRPLAWRKSADFLLTKLDFGRAQAGYWRESAGFAQPVYCGVLALPDPAMALKILDNIPDLKLPDGYLDKIRLDADYGFAAAIQELDELYRSGLDGAQLVVPANRRRFAEMLEKWIADKGLR